VPDDMSKWPQIDPSNLTYQRDLASLQVRGEPGQPGHEGHDAMRMDHGQMQAEPAESHQH
jgi:hypothetical protein